MAEIGHAEALTFDISEVFQFVVQTWAPSIQEVVDGWAILKSFSYVGGVFEGQSLCFGETKGAESYLLLHGCGYLVNVLGEKLKSTQGDQRLLCKVKYNK